MRRWALLGAIGLVSFACVGDDVAIVNRDGASSSGANGESSSGASGASSGGFGTSSGGTSSDSGVGCESTCVDDVRLSRCEDGATTVVTCGIGCDSIANRCRTFEPVGPATRDDLSATGLRAVTLDGVRLDLRNGQIVRGADEIRAANTTANEIEQVIAGVGFRIEAGVAILRARALTIGSVTTHGDLPLVVVAADDIVVDGEWRVTCGSAGGKAGGATGQAATAPMGGKPVDDNVFNGISALPGAGGGANVGAGGVGGTPELVVGLVGECGGAGGVAVSPDFEVLRGGGGGAGALIEGGHPNTLSLGGAGGGAIQLVAGARIEICRPGTTAGPIFGINVGGCGASRAQNANPEDARPRAAGAGGGAGGSLILEAPVVIGHAYAGIAANGGGGGPGVGQDGQISTSPARGVGAYCSAKGGDGAAGEVIVGQRGVGDPSTPCPDSGAAPKSGGGGGGAGYISVRTYVGAASFDPSFVISPRTPATFREAKLAEPR